MHKKYIRNVSTATLKFFFFYSFSEQFEKYAVCIPPFINSTSAFTQSLSTSRNTETMNEAVGTQWHLMPNFILYGCDQSLSLSLTGMNYGSFQAR